MNAPATAVLTPATVPGYVAGRPSLHGWVDPASLVATEVGDGNLNLVFRCVDGAGRRVVLKQALPYVRLVGPDWPMTVERAAREAGAIRVHAGLSDDVCLLLDFDEPRHVLVLEDLSDHEVFRTRLNDGGSHAGVAERLAEYVADVAFGTSAPGLGERGFRRRAAASANPELCEITEDLVLTEPFLGAERNSVRPVLAPLVAALQADAAWVAAAMACKHRFLTAGEALLHGDLHTGSVFVRGHGAGDSTVRDAGTGLSVRVFDPEFACYGPVGFDLGLLWANMLFASARAGALGDPARARSLAASVPVSWTRFAARLRRHWPDRRAPGGYPDAYLEAWLSDIMRDALGFAGCEAARRVIGLAKVSDLETLGDEPYRAAGTAMLRLSRLLLVERATLCPEVVAARASAWCAAG